MRFDSELFPSPVSLAAPSNDPPRSETLSGTRRRARLHHWQLAVAADSLAAITCLNDMINRSSIAAAEQLFADTAPTLVANIEHKQTSFADDSRAFAE
jgi:hypothetical protein